MSPSMCLRESMYIWNLPVLSVGHPNTAQQRLLAIPCVFLTYSVVSGLSARPPISICHCVVRCAVPSYPPTNRAIVLSVFFDTNCWAARTTARTTATQGGTNGSGWLFGMEETGGAGGRRQTARGWQATNSEPVSKTCNCLSFASATATDGIKWTKWNRSPV